MPEAMSVTRPSGEIALGVVIEVIPSLSWADDKGQKRSVVYIRDSGENLRLALKFPKNALI